MGSFEMLRVAPLRFVQLLLGKTLAYVLFVTIAGVILTGLMALLKVPMPSNIAQFLVLLILLALFVLSESWSMIRRAVGRPPGTDPLRG